ncbi:MAG: hypothetical protein BJ554DRAFT_1215 [Olpidium bornovanus]|uniref:Uncharacterized protein n=1 Tax=Olpidium bornovanus TaxID=278681 RepID=A0A8H7ZSN5_9FUNG|nr:MAG: hypothetical protein BJ554DRAFT_1215 [Olpidium bornovanus]
MQRRRRRRRRRSNMSVELRRDPDRTPFRFQMSATVFLTRMRAINHALISPKPKISRRTRNRLLLFVFLGFLLVIGSNPAQLFGQGNVLQLMAMICVALFLAVLLVTAFTRTNS